MDSTYTGSERQLVEHKSMELIQLVHRYEL